MFLFRIDLARRNRFSPVKQGSSLLDTCKLLSECVHRVPVINDEGKVVNIISQYSLVSYLQGHVCNKCDNYVQC